MCHVAHFDWLYHMTYRTLMARKWNPCEVVYKINSFALLQITSLHLLIIWSFQLIIFIRVKCFFHVSMTTIYPFFFNYNYYWQRSNSCVCWYMSDKYLSFFLCITNIYLVFFKYKLLIFVLCFYTFISEKYLSFLIFINDECMSQVFLCTNDKYVSHVFYSGYGISTTSPSDFYSSFGISTTPPCSQFWISKALSESLKGREMKSFWGAWNIKRIE